MSLSDLGPAPTTPTDPERHGRNVPRGIETTPESSTRSGRFGRMFRHVPRYEQQADSLVELGRKMVQGLENGKLDKPLGEQDDDENTAKLDGELRLPAGYTYFGQFVDHDITFDPVSSLRRQNDPDALTDFRSPRFDLDSLYGRGPADQPYLYDGEGLYLSLGEESRDSRILGPDLPRVGDRALIGDPRNDENVIVSQLHVAFLRFHNAVVHKFKKRHPERGKTDLFKLAQQQVRWHYQWVVIHDYLRRLVGPEVIADILRPEKYVAPLGAQTVPRDRRLFYCWRRAPFIPVEFSVAAYRFGHSMARPSYVINDVVPLPVVEHASRIPLFSQTGGPSLNGFRALPTDCRVQWKYLLPGTSDAPGPHDAELPQPSYRLDAVLSNPLGALPKSVAKPEEIVPGQPPKIAQSLPIRNLIRGLRLGLPSGQDVARAMGVDPLSDNELLCDLGLSDRTRRDLIGAAPLWFYVLKEAEVKADAAHLGPVGGRIVAEVLVGLLSGDPLSYLSVDPNWTPTLPSRVEGIFDLTDIIELAKAAPDAPEPAAR
jgi:Animal haem peroxidase